MNRLRESCVLVSGLGGLGAEIAKNIVLSGVGSLILQDSQQMTYSDLSSQVGFSLFLKKTLLYYFYSSTFLKLILAKIVLNQRIQN